ncbi:MAG: Sec-independent protein translocase protein TatB [Pseudomonadota bacterium]
MNPGIGAPELIILAILALVVVGPKDLPLMMRKVGRALGHVRAMARDFQRSFDELGREAELAELRKEVDALKKANPLSEMEREMRAAEADLRAGEDVARPRRLSEAEMRPHPRAVESPKPSDPVKTGAAAEPGDASSSEPDKPAKRV